MRIVVVALVLSMASSSVMADELDVARQQFAEKLKERRVKSRALQVTSPPIERAFNAAEARYNAVTPRVRACTIGRWQAAFKEPFKTLDDARASLEAGNGALREKRRAAGKVLGEQDDRRILVDMEYAKKDKDAEYYKTMLDITAKVDSDYTAVMVDVVNPGYQKYTSGIDQLTEAYDRYATDCAKDIPGRKIKVTLKAVMAKIDPITIAATALKALVGL